MAVTSDQLTQLYLAYFGRPPDFDGMVYYPSHPELDIWQVAATFGGSAESQALYGPTFGEAQVRAIYQNLFNRDAEADGIAYWTGEVAAGHLSAGGAAYAILLGARNDDAIAVQNKLVISSAFFGHLDTAAEVLAYSGNTAAASARAFLHTVGSTDASVVTATAAIDSTIAAIVGINPAPPPAPAPAPSPPPAPAPDVNPFPGLGGLTSQVIADGVPTGTTVSYTGLAWGATVEMAGALDVNDGRAKVALVANSTTDMLNVVLDGSFVDDNNTTAALKKAFTVRMDTTGIETLHLTSTADQTATFTPVTHHAADFVSNAFDLVDTSLKTLTVSGDQYFSFTPTSNMTALADIDARSLAPAGTLAFDGLDIGLSVNASGINAGSAIAITGSTSVSSKLVGSSQGDTITGGTNADWIYGGPGGDKLTGGAGSDVFSYGAAAESTLLALDTITDFSANTVGLGTSGAVDKTGAAAVADRNGDVIDLRSFSANNDGQGDGFEISVGVFASGSDATVYLQNVAALHTYDIAAALDSTTGRLYIDTNGDGSLDMVIQLSGVKTLDAAAFLLV